METLQAITSEVGESHVEGDLEIKGLLREGQLPVLSLINNDDISSEHETPALESLAKPKSSKGFQTLKGKVKSMINKDAITVLNDFERYLQTFHVVSSPFQDILTGNLNRKKKLWQFFSWMAEMFYMIPHYGFICLVYFLPKQDQAFYQYYLIDYFEAYGLFGKTLNIMYFFFTCAYVVNIFILRQNEARGTLEFLTDFLRLKTDQNWCGLHEKDTKALLSKLKKKIQFVNVNIRPTIFCCQMYDVIAVVIFFTAKKPDLLVSCLAIWQCCIAISLVYVVLSHFFFLYLGFVMVIDCISARCKSLSMRINKIKKGSRKQDDIKRLLEDMDTLRNTFEIYNKPMRPLIRNMVYLFRGALCGIFFHTTIKTNPFVRILMANCVVGLTLCFLATGVYISQSSSELTDLYHKLNSLYVRAVAKESVDFKARIRFRTTIKEYGTQNEDGHFILGFADGNGPSFTKTEMMELTFETIANTLMVMKMNLNVVKKWNLT